MTTRVTLQDHEIPWDRFFTVAPLVLVGTREADGGHDLAPKHMAMPLGWGRWFGFVCTPDHRTWQNAVRTGEFTVSFPTAALLVGTSLAASPRVDCDGDKPGLAALPVEPAESVDGVLVSGCSVYLECTVDRTVDGLDDNGLIVGKVVAVHASEDVLRGPDVDDADLLFRDGPLAYLHPGRFTEITSTHAFPFPKGFKR